MQNWKTSQMAVFLVTFRLLLAMFLKSHAYDFDAIAHIGLQYGEESP